MRTAVLAALLTLMLTHGRPEAFGEPPAPPSIEALAKRMADAESALGELRGRLARLQGDASLWVVSSPSLEP